LSYYTVFAIPPLFVIVIFIATLCLDETQVHANRFGITLQPKKHARWILPPEEKPPSQALSSPCIEASGRKAQLVSELRDEVESLRALVHR
jgi:hypothetical protein